jgi:hypothetical protein
VASATKFGYVCFVSVDDLSYGLTHQNTIGKFNILTSVGDNDSLQIAIGKGNLITKVGSGHREYITSWEKAMSFQNRV